MARKVYKANALSVSDMRKLADDLRRYANSLEHKARLLAEKLSERGVEIARVQIADLDAIFTGELLSSIHSEYKGSFKGGGIFAIVADDEAGVFVEFGTGQYGKDTPYPYPLPDGVSWDYATGKTIRQNAAGRYYWFYPGQDGKWHYTEGLPARPFMMNTSLELQKEIVKIAKEIFK